MSRVLEVRDAVRTYHRGREVVRAVDGAALDLDVGQAVALVGPSGSGKTTFMNLIVGWETLESGDIRWQPPVADPGRWGDVAVVPQRLGLLQELTVGANIRWPLRLAGRRGVQAGEVGQAGEAGEIAEVEALEERLGLSHLAKRRVTEVSLGEQQRTAIARALVLQPAVLIADEPTGHQDEESADAVFAALDAARERGTAMIVATHDPRFLTHADAVVRMRDGVTTLDA